eukprot:TRINITY_DN1118_c0_g1_i25.p3 TRINITY_DN1118_c0_g1~~TRINITY_DN1118_c0_g1_i25.p3  ORF type:complete len:117 (+),score=14.81 TRINITY_DN1118_c0_g1_i25:636-986(+)
MLDAIEKVHSRGYIHRDIKPSNFVVGRGERQNQVYIVDFGLCRRHLDERGEPFEQRKVSEFRGTVGYASLNAHNRIVSTICDYRICPVEKICGAGILLRWISLMKSWSGECRKRTR